MSINVNTDAIENLTDTDLKQIFDLFARQNGYTETPPTIQEFITDPYYLGDSLNGGKSVFPFWRKKLIEIFPTPFFESNTSKLIILSGATGIGKSTFASLVFLYDLARVLCLESPQEKFGLPKASTIYFTLTNSTLENAEQVNFDPIITFIRQSPFFRSKFDPSKSKRNLFINNIDINIVSRKHSLVGKNVFSALSDEVNQEVVKGGSRNIVTEMYNRINSRFLLKGNKWPGHYSIISSATTESSLIQSLIDNAKDTGKEDFSKKDILIISAPRFEVLKHKVKYSGETFKIFIGDYQSDPFFINSNDELQRAKQLDETKIYEVPIEHKGEFDTDIYAGIRDVLGVAVSDVRTFIPFKDKINESLQLTKIAPDEIILDPEAKLIEYFQKDLIDKFKPGSQKVIGLDIALSGDRFGMAMVHYHEIRKSGGIEEFVCWVDFAIGIKPPKGRQIQLWQIRDFIIDLQKLGCNIELVVSDSYQSVDTLQLLKKQGIETKTYSVDRKKDAYYTLRNAILENRIYMPNNKILYKELVFLKENEKKIDHPEFFPDGTVGSKDIADAVCNAYFNLINEVEYRPYMESGFIDELEAVAESYNDISLSEKLFGTPNYLQENIY